MSLCTRAVIAVLAGMGAGVLGFWATWQSIQYFTNSNPAPEYDTWIVVGIFAPLVATALTAYTVMSRATTQSQC